LTVGSQEKEGGEERKPTPEKGEGGERRTVKSPEKENEGGMPRIFAEKKSHANQEQKREPSRRREKKKGRCEATWEGYEGGKGGKKRGMASLSWPKPSFRKRGSHTRGCDPLGELINTIERELRTAVKKKKEETPSPRKNSPPPEKKKKKTKPPQKKKQPHGVPHEKKKGERIHLMGKKVGGGGPFRIKLP